MTLAPRQLAGHCVVVDAISREAPKTECDFSCHHPYTGADLPEEDVVVTSLAAIFVIAATVATPVGEWLVADKSSKVVLGPCGPNLCGKLSWTSDGQDIGRVILIDMKPDGDRWTGTIVDVRDNSKYLAHIQLQNANALKLDGCVLNGAICGGEVWTRTK